MGYDGNNIPGFLKILLVIAAAAIYVKLYNWRPKRDV